MDRRYDFRGKLLERGGESGVRVWVARLAGDDLRFDVSGAVFGGSLHGFPFD